MVRKNMKKVISTLAIASILGTTVVTPLNVLSTKGYAAEEVHVASETAGISNPNLFNTSLERDINNTFKYWSFTPNGLNFSGATPNKVTSNSGARVETTGEGNLSMSHPIGESNLSAYQIISTEIGKEYSISADYSQVGYQNGPLRLTATTIGISLIGQADFGGASGFAKLTFIAKDTSTRVGISIMAPGSRSVRSAILNNITLVKTGDQMAKDGLEAAETSVKDLFNNGDVTGTIKDTTDQAAIDKAQKAVDAVTDATKKAALQKKSR
ncbi:toxin Cry1Ac domain D-VI-related protein [Listeria cornellensis]|uniref:Pesticidal crystal protein Cry1Aa domain-containing protein n=1 Tax=Listeria cornellensis FSL F6-0969 TaxID=1265820 RepID=W7BGR2_9LIST|nr:toxin Cry1Ac domain D-VI-related protein [Listeria cornellensis]EUJ24000.1 hypothetical protein PCORN_18901 [Listeria cornellensis FSL F6-0969]